MNMKIGFVIDPIESIDYKKDSTLAMLKAAHDRGIEVCIFEQKDMWVVSDEPMAQVKRLLIGDINTPTWYQISSCDTIALSELDIIVMRKDPPFDMDYVMTTYLLELCEAKGVLVANRPQSLRDANEKLMITQFPQCIVPTLIASQKGLIIDFLSEHEDIILKPLDGMGGASIFRVKLEDPNINVIVEQMTLMETKMIMVQRYIPAIDQGDKRILLIDGEPVSHALARLPAVGETRANLAAGGSYRAQILSEKDRWLCSQVKSRIQSMGLYFVGLDVIGDYITEINVTSPTCIRQIDREVGSDIGGDFIDHLVSKRHNDLADRVS